MIRTLDPTFINGIANHPSVRPWIAAGVEPIDISGAVSNPANIALVSAHGGFVLTKNEPGIYECHSLFVTEGRGTEVIETARGGLRYVFAATDCLEIVTKVPLANKPAIGLARAFGFTERFRRKDAWTTADGACDVSYQGLTLGQWMARDAEVLTAGEWFHETLEAAKEAAGSALDTHPDDPSHNRAAGAAVLMARAGNVGKGVLTYNRWARLAGYATIDLISQHPPVIDVRDAVVEVRGQDMQVLLCR